MVTAAPSDLTSGTFAPARGAEYFYEIPEALDSVLFTTE